MKQGWGPFTGRQLTTIIVTLIIGAVMIPSTAWAVDTFTNVAIQDPVSGSKASVSSDHKVLVSGGFGGLAVAGTVNDRMANPLKPWSISNDVVFGGGVFVPVGMVGPTSSTISLTSIQASLKAGQTGEAELFIYRAVLPVGGTDCHAASNFYQTLYHVAHIGLSSPLQMSFTTPMVFTPNPGQPVCITAANNGAAGSTMTVNLNGFSN